MSNRHSSTWRERDDKRYLNAPSSSHHSSRSSHDKLSRSSHDNSSLSSHETSSRSSHDNSSRSSHENPCRSLPDNSSNERKKSDDHSSTSEIEKSSKRRDDAENTKSRRRDVDYRRSTAAQFFAEEETVQEAITAEKVVEYISRAIDPPKGETALQNLKHVVDFILRKEPKLLDNFFEEVISFQHDSDKDVRIFVVQFIEDSCQHNIQILPKIIGNLNILILDTSIFVVKKVIQAFIQLYKLGLRWLCKAKSYDEVMEATWASMTVLKSKIFCLVESDNEGVRLLTIKLLEAVVISQTFKDQHSPKDDFSLDKVPVILKIFRPRKMEEEAKEVFMRMLEFHGAPHVSSLNLMACMHALTTIAKKRFEFFPKVLQAFESLHANLPPTLSQSQVSSVRKSLKLELFTLVKHPGAVEFQSRMSILLSDLGANPQQLAKYFPNLDTPKKRSASKELEGSANKKAKLGLIDLTDSKVAFVKMKDSKQLKAKNTAIDITAEDLVPKFVTLNVADLVLVSMLSLPEIMPPHFQSTYTPIAAAGTEPQVKHLARLLATQLTIAGLGKGVEETKFQPSTFEEVVLSDEEEDSGLKKIQTVVGQIVDVKPSKQKQTLVLMPSGTFKPKSSRCLDFQSVVKPLSTEESDKLSRAAFNRIVKAEKFINKRVAGGMRTKILTTLATNFRSDFSLDLRNHILENPRTRLDLGFSWIYQEYSACRGFESSAEEPIENYEESINQILSGVLQNEDQNRLLFSRFYIDPPLVTETMAECLKVIATDETSTETALQLAKSMTIRRPNCKLLFLGVISDLTLHENAEIRNKSVNIAVEIHESGSMQTFIETFALRSLKLLLSDTPLASDFVFVSQPLLSWTEDLTKMCLHLYLSLLPVNHHLIHDLGTVYVETAADIKRTILRALESPVKGMSMSSPELLQFVEKCPKGAETLVTRIIHILTDKAPPSVELVARVRDLYRKRVPDVRFLIPIINGLTKREIISALPELIKLNPTVVKEVFHRLLGSNFSSPLSPAELLVALHNIDQTKCNLKIIIKATSMCFEEKNVYTQVVLAMVMQQLMEQNPLPILLMRTVIQSLASYPHLLGFVTNILQRLIVKQVWKQKKIWEGFIKCCQRTKPQSFQVLLQLPPPQLLEVLQSCLDLRDPLCQHVETFTEHQKAHIPKAVLDVIAGFNPKEPKSDDASPTTDENDEEPPPPGHENL